MQSKSLKQKTLMNKLVSQSKRSLQVKEATIAQNLIQLSNIQYLLRFVKYTDYDPKVIFQKALKQAQDAQIKQRISKSAQQKNKQMMRLNILNISNTQTSCLQQVKYQKLSREYIKLHQKCIKDKVKLTVDKSIGKQKIAQILSRQQLLNRASEKIREQKLKQEKQIARSRRSYQYVQNLKARIQQKLQQDQQLNQITYQQQEIIQILQFLQLRRYNIKMQFYYIQKQENTQQLNQFKLSLYNELVQNINKARNLYLMYFSKSISTNTNQYQIVKNLNLTSSSSSSNNKQIKKHSILTGQLSMSLQTSPQKSKNKAVLKIQKFLNSIILDERQITLIAANINSAN